MKSVYLNQLREISKLNKQVSSQVDQDSKEGGLSFKNIINNELNKVNQKQIKADKLTEGFISGQVEDLHDVLIATEEARLSLELAVQIRNKVIEGFKEINNMQL